MNKSLLLFATFISINAHAQTELWGMTRQGGQYNGGTIFKTDGSGNNQTVQYDFMNVEGAKPKFTSLLQASDGKLYGMTSEGGNSNTGIIFQYDPFTEAYTKKFDFSTTIIRIPQMRGESLQTLVAPNHTTNSNEQSSTSIGAVPWGGLIQASDKKLYGMTTEGGINNAGVIFQYDVNTNTYNKQFDFEQTPDGSFPNGDFPIGSLIEAVDGMLYGMTWEGGIFNAGVLFLFNPATSIYQKKFDFDFTNGGHPYGSLMKASDGKLYGMTWGGGVNGAGVLFQFDPMTSTYTKKLDFSAITNGQQLYGSLIQAVDGKLYGMAKTGGVNNMGVLFQFDPINNTYLKKFDFDSTAFYPYGSLIEASDKNLYGMTSSGGANGGGILFQFNPSNGSLIKKLDFGGANIGTFPMGTLMQASDGKIYGLTNSGGVVSGGVIFQFDPVNSNYSKKKEFGEALNGKTPNGSLIQTLDGKLYGMTHDGGVNNMGTLFQYEPSSYTLTKLIDFNGIVNGSNPQGSLIQASDNKLYGMTSSGGANGDGVLFQFDPTTSIYKKLLDFEYATIGSNPIGSLIQASDGKLYGTAKYGGANTLGVLFQFDHITSVFTKKLDFDIINGGYPEGSLIQALDGTLYGTTSYGGSNSTGVLFQFDLTTFTYTKKIDFDEVANGKCPQGSLIQASDGKLYGTTTYGGANTLGVLFQYDPISLTYTKKIDFDGSTNGSNPMGTFMQASDGKLYGMTYSGGNNNGGVLLQYDPVTSTFNKKFDFNKTSGSGPTYSNLIEIAVSIKTLPISSSICVDCSIKVPYVITGAYDAGNIFTAQLSDENGSFGLQRSQVIGNTSVPVNIGSLSTTKAGTINAVIPANTVPGDSYKIRVVSSNPVTIGKDNGSNITITSLSTSILKNINNDNGVSISPNPFTSQTTFDFIEEQHNSTMKIVDVLGKEIKEINFSGKQLILEKGDMKEGIYFIQVTDADINVINKKIVVQ